MKQLVNLLYLLMKSCEILMKENAYFHFSLFSLQKKSFFTTVKHMFRTFTDALPESFFLNSANTQNLRENLSNCNFKKVYIINRIFFHKYRIYFHLVV
jgi:hypothetical protein